MIEKIIIAILASWIISQGIKIVIDLYKNRKVSLRILLRSGGMPSTHTAIVTALTTGIFFIDGTSLLFLTSLVFSIIVVADATGVRLDSERQASAINKIGNLKGKNKLNEHIGHTHIEAFAGTIIGFIITVALFLI